MNLKNIFNLIKKDISLEWRNRYSAGSVILYMVGSVFIISMAVPKGKVLSDVRLWNAFFWILILFSAITATMRSFVEESKNRYLYYYQLFSPQDLVVAKLIFNFLFLTVLTILCLVVYIFLMGSPIQDLGMFLFICLLGSVSLSSGLTLNAAIAAKTKGNSALMAILSFPLVLPILGILIRLGKQAIDGLDHSVSIDEIQTISALSIVMISVSVLLFPYLWRT